MVRDSFTGKEIPRGRGLMFVKKDGTIYYFGSKKSEKNLLKLKRNPVQTKWTEYHKKEKKTAGEGKKNRVR